MLLISLDLPTKPSSHGRGCREFISGKADVANLKSEQIEQLTCDDLVCAVRAAHLPCVNEDFEERLQFCDRETLQRLVYLARRCCRNQGY